MTPVKYERIKFLVIALKNAVEIYAWAPKPYHKFMAFKVCLKCLPHFGLTSYPVGLALVSMFSYMFY